ncbi:MAG: glycerophosphodiester phosphodiesterase family protein [Pirellulaceae bacterium]
MIHNITCTLCATALLLVCSARLIADDGKPADRPVKKLILSGESFLVDDRPAFILWPPKEHRRTPQPWIMYAATLPAYPDSHETWMHEQFVAAGVAVAGIDVGEAYGSPAGQKHFTALYRELTQKRGFAPRPCLLGRSRGGLWVSSWAIHNTDKVSGIAGIYPVFDLRTYPGLSRAAPAYGLKPHELEATLDRHNPIAQIDVLAKAKVPVLIIHGDADKVVPLKENSATLVERYQQAKAGDVVDLIVVEGQGHNYWPGFFRCQELIDFAIQRAKVGVSPVTAGSTVPQGKRPQVDNATDPIPVAHRGLLRHAPENTLPAFAACLELGMGFELDIRTTQDGHLVVLHDDSVERTTNGPNRSIRDMTLDEVRQLDAGGWFDPSFTGVRVPTLEETLALVKNRKRGSTIIALNVKQLTPDGEAALVSLVEKYALLDESFAFDQSAEISRRLKKRNPDFRIAQNVNRKSLGTRLQEDFLDVFLLTFAPTPEEVHQLHEHDKQVLFNFAGPGEARRNSAVWKQVRDAGIDGLLTDYPLECRRAWRPPERSEKVKPQ